MIHTSPSIQVNNLQNSWLGNPNANCCGFQSTLSERPRSEPNLSSSQRSSIHLKNSSNSSKTELTRSRKRKPADIIKGDSTVIRISDCNKSPSKCSEPEIALGSHNDAKNSYLLIEKNAYTESHRFSPHSAPEASYDNDDVGKMALQWNTNSQMCESSEDVEMTNQTNAVDQSAGSNVDASMAFDLVQPKNTGASSSVWKPDSFSLGSSCDLIETADQPMPLLMDSMRNNQVGIKASEQVIQRSSENSHSTMVVQDNRDDLAANDEIDTAVRPENTDPATGPTRKVPKRNKSEQILSNLVEEASHYNSSHDLHQSVGQHSSSMQTTFRFDWTSSKTGDSHNSLERPETVTMQTPPIMFKKSMIARYTSEPLTHESTPKYMKDSPHVSALWDPLTSWMQKNSSSSTAACSSKPAKSLREALASLRQKKDTRSRVPQIRRWMTSDVYSGWPKTSSDEGSSYWNQAMGGSRNDSIMTSSMSNSSSSLDGNHGEGERAKIHSKSTDHSQTGNFAPINLSCTRTTVEKETATSLNPSSSSSSSTSFSSTGRACCPVNDLFSSTTTHPLIGAEFKKDKLDIFSNLPQEGHVTKLLPSHETNAIRRVHRFSKIMEWKSEPHKTNHNNESVNWQRLFRFQEDPSSVCYRNPAPVLLTGQNLNFPGQICTTPCSSFMTDQTLLLNQKTRFSGTSSAFTVLRTEPTEPSEGAQQSIPVFSTNSPTKPTDISTFSGSCGLASTTSSSFSINPSSLGLASNLAMGLTSGTLQAMSLSSNTKPSNEEQSNVISNPTSPDHFSSCQTPNSPCDLRVNIRHESRASTPDLATDLRSDLKTDFMTMERSTCPATDHYGHPNSANFQSILGSFVDFYSRSNMPVSPKHHTQNATIFSQSVHGLEDRSISGNDLIDQTGIRETARPSPSPTKANQDRLSSGQPTRSDKSFTSIGSGLSRSRFKSSFPNGSHVCPQCKRNFTRSDMLVRHMHVHTKDKPFECNHCGQKFSRSDHLSTHRRTHTGHRPYSCEYCSYSACRRDMITRHMRVHEKGHNSGRLHYRRTTPGMISSDHTGLRTESELRWDSTSLAGEKNAQETGMQSALGVQTDLDLSETAQAQHVHTLFQGLTRDEHDRSDGTTGDNHQ